LIRFAYLKSRSDRYLPLYLILSPSHTAAAVGQEVKLLRQFNSNNALSRVVNCSECVVLHKGSKRYLTTDEQQRFIEATKQSKWVKFYLLVFHSLRHTFCSTLANVGAQLQEIASLAGHKSIQTTMRYTHLDNKRLSTVVSKTFGMLGSKN